MKTTLKKIAVCEDCLSPTITDINCACTYTAYRTIELEFEFCPCCNGHIDNQPADTEFNIKQLENLNRN